MKKLFAMPLFILSLAADANTYIKFGYGINSIDTNEIITFSDDIYLVPKGSDNIWELTAGYKINNNFAIETDFQRFQKNVSQRKTHDTANTANNLTETDRLWNADLQANRLSIKSLYLHRFHNDIQVNTGIGLTLTQYDFTASTSFDNENKLNVQETGANSVVEPQSSDSRSEVKVGAMASIGFDYSLWQNITLGADANLSVDGIASTLQLLGTVGYRF